MNGDLISRSALLAKSKPFRLGNGEQWTGNDVPRFISESDVINAPAVDAVEVVRCRECKHKADVTDKGNYLCNRKMLGVVRPTDFCSFGERKDHE